MQSEILCFSNTYNMENNAIKLNYFVTTSFIYTTVKKMRIFTKNYYKVY